MSNNKADVAVDFFKQGFNCAQAIVMTFQEEIELDISSATKISQPFGGGMGRLRQVCGAVSGIFMVLGMKNGADFPDGEQKKELYMNVQKLAHEFERQTGSIICGVLLDLPPEHPEPEERSEEYYTRRPCAEYVRIAAQITDDFLRGKL